MITSLAELKRALQPGAVVTMTANEGHPDARVIGVPRTVVSADAVSFGIDTVHEDGSHATSQMLWPNPDEVEFTDDGFIMRGRTYRIDKRADEVTDSRTEMAAIMVSCPNGHENPEDRHYCGECGLHIVKPVPGSPGGQQPPQGHWEWVQTRQPSPPYVQPQQVQQPQNFRKSQSAASPTGFKGFWSGLSDSARRWLVISVIAAVILVIGAAIIVSNWRDKPSYRAGYEDGTGFARTYTALSSDPMSDPNIKSICAQEASMAVNNGGVWWSGGRLERKDLHVNDYKDGCFDAVRALVPRT